MDKKMVAMIRELIEAGMGLAEWEAGKRGVDVGTIGTWADIWDTHSIERMKALQSLLAYYDDNEAAQARTRDVFGDKASL